jgi:hypothetical protein
MRSEFIARLGKLEGRDIYYLDESGVDRRLFRQYARAPRGVKVYADVHGARGKRVSIISASKGHKLVAPMVFDGCCNRDVVDAYFRDVLLPALPLTSIHKTSGAITNYLVRYCIVMHYSWDARNNSP